MYKTSEEILKKVQELLLWKSYSPSNIKVAINNSKGLNCDQFKSWPSTHAWICELRVNWIEIITDTKGTQEIVEVELI